MKINIIKKLILPIILLTLALTVFFVPPVFAQLDGWGGQAANIQAGTGLGNTDPRVMVANVIRVALGFLGIIALVLILYAGFLWMTSNGDTSKIDKAKKILISAVIGLIIILASFAIASFVLSKLLSGSGGGGGGCTDGEVGGTCCAGTGNYICAGGTWLCDSSFCGGGPGATSTLVSCGTTYGSCEAPLTCNALGEFFCKQSNCLCNPKGGLGANCNSTALPVCSPDNDACQTGLTCGPTSCKCEGSPIIDYVSPAGGFCLNSAGTPTNFACTNNSDCLSVLPLSSCATSTPNGATGNFVTIGGRFFGTTTGEVQFNGVTAQLANTLPDGNPSCTDAWSDNRVVVIVPAAAGNGPISLARWVDPADMIVWQDTTNNVPNKGPVIQDFLKNNIIRPGLCDVNPESGVMGNPVNYLGINLLGTRAFFGNYLNNVAGVGNAFTDDKSGVTAVPNIKAGQTSTFALIGSTTSNYLNYRKLDETKNLHYITSFGPINGNTGQYVTVHGFGFGYADVTQLGITHHAYLDNNLADNDISIPSTLGVEVDYKFPDDCADNLWNDKQIVFKVPGGLVSGQTYYIVIYVNMGVNNWGNFIDSSELPTITTSNISPLFTYNALATLSPGLCRIAPAMGMPGITPVEMFGEYFGPVATGNVQFSNILMSGFNNTSWTINNPGNAADKIATTVPALAITGLVNVFQGAVTNTNSLNFAIGSCLSAGSTQIERNTACGGYVCCSESSPKAGRCEVNADECFTGPSTSVYEWDFSTGVDGGGGATGPGSCSGYDLNQCVDTIFCPNSPGHCSPYAGGAGLLDTQVACSATNSAGLNYNSVINRYASTTQTCTVDSTDLDIFGNSVKTYCAPYGNVGPRMHFKTSLSCPVGWSPELGGCVNLTGTCDMCSSGFSCFSGGASGVCAVNKLVCPNGSTCNASEKCVKDDDESCDCCCEIGGTQDCCTGLTCEGSCGSDTNPTDNAGLGECGGCKQVDALGNVNQLASNNACNCTGTTGKFCETNDPQYPQGVCRDCQTLGDPDFCTNIGVGQCCVDGKGGNQCTGFPGDTSLDTVNTPPYAYCSYYDCASNGMSCGTASTTGKYINDNTCKGECAPTLAGAKCSKIVLNALACSYDYCKELYCLDASGSELSACDATGNNCTACADGSCGNCCCDPALTGEDATNVATYDKCNNINPILTCEPNKTPCDSPTNDRGLCCGCSVDADCGAAGVTNGCGSDTCCRTRPVVETTAPLDDATSVCRNAKITATFSEKMDANSFAGNVLVVGDYGTDVCPAGTQYLTENSLGNKKNIFARVYNKIVDFVDPILPTFIVNALTPTDVTHSYCAITGSVSGHTNAADRGVLEFLPTGLLEADTLYYVIIKGDEVVPPDVNMDSKKGVKSYWGISMNDAINTINPTNPDNNNSRTFNRVLYQNSHVFSFRTMPNQGEGAGVCRVENVKIEPTSYLFQTNKNDVVDDNYDSGADLNFDKIKDSDKVFVANAYSTDNQMLYGVPGFYDWTWTWNGLNNSVANIVPVVDLPSNEVLIRTEPDVVDDKTIVRAISTISDDTIFIPSTVGSTREAVANIYVFVCMNPWPSVSALGTWSPWIDQGANCASTPTAPCSNTNFEIYYCRDSGGPGTFDDLPAVANSTGDLGVVRGQVYNELLKEVYFFGSGKTAVPAASVDSVSAVNDPASLTGGSVMVGWSSAAATQYKVYWGTSAGNYQFSTTTAGTLITIGGLTNNINYYFNVASVSTSGVESGLFNSTDASVLVRDVAEAVPPANLFVRSACNRVVDLGWPSSTDASVKGYIVYYGKTSGVYGASKDAGGLRSITLNNLTNGATYYFIVRAYDENDSLSLASAEVSVVLGATADNYDFDSDGIFDCVDNCPTLANADQGDADNDDIGDLCD